MPDSPFFSIILLSWNAEPYLSSCLKALDGQAFKDFEIIIFDNGSSQPFQFDQLLPNTRTLRSETNLGFAAGNNEAAKHAKGRYLVLLNADAFPDPDWLEQIHQACLQHPGCFFASKLIREREPDYLDGEWNVVHCSGLAWRRNHFKSAGQAHQEPKEVLSACAAAGVYPREAFEAVNGFDPSFFSYMEDIDLDMRMQALGYRCLYLPRAVVRHVGSGSTGSRSGFQLYYGHRNLVWNFIKNMPGAFFWLLLPAHIFYNLLYLLASFVVVNGKEIRRAKYDALKGLKPVWAKRQHIQSTRQVPAWEIAKKLDWNPLSPFIKLTYH